MVSYSISLTDSIAGSVEELKKIENRPRSRIIATAIAVYAFIRLEMEKERGGRIMLIGNKGEKKELVFSHLF